MNQLLIQILIVRMMSWFSHNIANHLRQKASEIRTELRNMLQNKLVAIKMILQQGEIGDGHKYANGR